MFEELNTLESSREGILAIHWDNHASLQAHTRMREVALFELSGFDLAMFAFVS